MEREDLSYSNQDGSKQPLIDNSLKGDKREAIAVVTKSTKDGSVLKVSTDSFKD